MNVGDLVAVCPKFLEDEQIPDWRKKDVMGIMGLVIAMPTERRRARVIWLAPATQYHNEFDGSLSKDSWWVKRELVVISPVSLLDTSLTQKS
jgi:hypothetical protein